MTRKRLPIVTLLAMLTCTTAALASPALASAYTLTGAGSTLIQPLEEDWARNFEQRYGDKITYSPVGSGTGIKDISARTVDFGASDAPLTPAQASGCNSCIQIPWALTATGIAYNVPGIARLRLTGHVLAEIYLGNITNWDSPAIAALNKGEKLPNLTITPIYRSDSSGDTYAFTDYLSRVSTRWKLEVGTSTSVSFKVGVGGAKNSGVTALVSSTSGGIAYISASYIIAHGLQAAALQNAAGKYEYPNIKPIEDAASSVTHVPANNEMHIVDPPKKYKTAYPLSTFTYAIIPRTAPQKGALASWVYYAMTLGQVYGPALDFAPIPKVVLNAGIKSVKELQQG